MMNCLSCAFPGLANLYVVTVLHIEAACDICPMKPQPPSSAQSSRRPSRLDQWTIYLPAEIPPAFQTGSRRFEAARPATSETQRFQPSRDRFAAEPSSYFPKIRESAISRDKREKQLVVKQAHQGWNQSTRTCRRRFNSQSLQAASHVPTKSLATLDQDGMAVMRLAFERRGRLDEKDFTAEMLHALNAQELECEQQVNLIHELSSLYQQSDLHAAGFLTWEDFSSSIFKPSDEHSPEVDTASQRLKCQPDALNMSAELHGMYYFEGIDRVFLNDTRNRGFRLLDPSTNTLVGEFNAPSRGTSILDAVYSPMGRYVITASTSPVITLYDVDQLVIRQQIPTEVAQIALEISLGEATPRLYSSCTNGRIHVWNMETLSNSHSFFMKGHEVMTDIVAIHNTTHIAASCLDGKIYVLDVHLERIGKALTGHDKGVTMLKYCAHKGYLVSGGLDHCFHLWNPHVEQKIGSLKSHKHQLIGLEIVPDSPQVISADENGLVKIWDLRKFASVRTFKREAYHLITVSPFDGTFCVWKVKGGTVVATDSLICAATWISDELNDVFCVGDDHGFVTFYEFEGLFKEIDTIRRSLQVASRRKDSYSDQNDVTQLLSPALLQIRYGRCVGDLVDESIPWQLNLTKTETNETSNAAAAKMLQELKSHRRASQTPQRRQSQMKQEWIRSASLSVNAQENIAEEYAKRRPGLSRFLAVAKQL
ncbi:hypothetical protein PF008_g6681 [Phytophthora fragariae]|uniref:Uncharacterized protein n=1 Tax=Phytophthora fragariae TaxID=53985 RepID=A0A6G0S5S3_9STRA|nr:hypothetical protein PF008_g6681 [Phytophthora fragariae]